MKKDVKLTRRDFVKSASGSIAALSGLSLLACDKQATDPKNEKDTSPVGSLKRSNQRAIHNDLVPRRVLGKTGIEISMLVFGGGSNFLKNANGVWEPLMQKALDMGINYFDTSHDYGTEERFGEILPPIRDQVYITTKFDARDVTTMRSTLDASLKKLKTDYLDFLFIHSIETSDSVSQIEKGVYAEMLKLKEQGVTRFIGFSSMNSAVRSKELLTKLEFDACMLAMNPTTYGDFARTALPAAREKNVGVLAMKIMRDVVGNGATAEELIAYALDLEGVAATCIAHTGQQVLQENAAIIKDYAGSTYVRPDYLGLEQRIRHLAGPHALCWARPDYYDGKMC
ncbi:aldo/keto reductase [candidate division KSB1 bacterium]|nr:aldo/keto reductase [candidate division KSB1 bacterium]